MNQRVASLASALMLVAVPAPAALYHVLTPTSVAIQPTTRAATEADLSGLTQAKFDVFFAEFNHFGDWQWHPRGVTSTGYVYGYVHDDPHYLDTQFVYYQGEVLCCKTDSPWMILGGNAGGTWIGDYLGPWVGNVLTDRTIEPLTIELVNDPVHVYPNGYTTTLSEQLYNWNTRFTAIDDAGRIGGIWSGGSFVLTPVAVPEPASARLLGAMMLGFGLLRFQWMRGRRG